MHPLQGYSFVFFYNIPFIKGDPVVWKYVPTPNLNQVELILGTTESQNSKMLMSTAFVLVPATLATDYHKHDNQVSSLIMQTVGTTSFLL